MIYLAFWQAVLILALAVLWVGAEREVGEKRDAQHGMYEEMVYWRAMYREAVANTVYLEAAADIMSLLLDCQSTGPDVHVPTVEVVGADFEVVLN